MVVEVIYPMIDGDGVLSKTVSVQRHSWWNILVIVGCICAWGHLKYLSPPDDAPDEEEGLYVWYQQ